MMHITLIPPAAKFGKGQMGSALMGSLQISCFFDRGTFLVLSLTYFYLPESARAYLFPQSVKIITFAAAPLVLTPFARNQIVTRGVGRRVWRSLRIPAPRILKCRSLKTIVRPPARAGENWDAHWTSTKAPAHELQTAVPYTVVTDPMPVTTLGVGRWNSSVWRSLRTPAGERRLSHHCMLWPRAIDEMHTCVGQGQRWS